MRGSDTSTAMRSHSSWTCQPGHWALAFPLPCSHRLSKQPAWHRVLAPGADITVGFWVGPGSFRQRPQQVVRPQQVLGEGNPGGFCFLGQLRSLLCVSAEMGTPGHSVGDRSPLFPVNRKPHHHRGDLETLPRKVLFTPRGDSIWTPVGCAHDRPLEPTGDT